MTCVVFVLTIQIERLSKAAGERLREGADTRLERWGDLDRRRIRKRRAEAKVLASTSPLCVQCAPKLQSVFRFCRSLSSKHCSQCWQRSGWNIDTAPAKTFYLLRNKHLSPKGTILFCFIGLWSRFVNYIPHWYISGPYFLASTFLDNWPTTSCLNLIDSLEDWIWAKTCKFCFKSQKSIKTFNGR